MGCSVYSSRCGVCPAVAIMQALIKMGGLSQVQVIDYHTSAAASGDTASVVGYAGVLLD